jgi:hypothetical protein
MHFTPSHLIRCHLGDIASDVIFLNDKQIQCRTPPNPPGVASFQIDTLHTNVASDLAFEFYMTHQVISAFPTTGPFHSCATKVTFALVAQYHLRDLEGAQLDIIAPHMTWLQLVILAIIVLVPATHSPYLASLAHTVARLVKVIVICVRSAISVQDGGGAHRNHAKQAMFVTSQDFIGLKKFVHRGTIVNSAQVYYR